MSIVSFFFFFFFSSYYFLSIFDTIFFESRRGHTRGALVTGVQTCALPIYGGSGVVPAGPGIALPLGQLLQAVGDVVEVGLVGGEDVAHLAQARGLVERAGGGGDVVRRAAFPEQRRAAVPAEAAAHARRGGVPGHLVLVLDTEAGALDRREGAVVGEGLATLAAVAGDHRPQIAGGAVAHGAASAAAFVIGLRPAHRSPCPSRLLATTAPTKVRSGERWYGR